VSDRRVTTAAGGVAPAWLLASSPYNNAPVVSRSWHLPDVVILNDCTLREGEQSALVNFSADDKLVLARDLADLGVSQIQTGYPGTSLLDREVLRRIRQEFPVLPLEGVLLAYRSSWQEELERFAESRPDFVNIVVATSDHRLRHVFHVDRAAVLRRVRDTVRHARGLGLRVAFSPADGTRTQWTFLRRVFHEAIEAGAERIYIADTAGACTPRGIGHLVGLVRRSFPVSLGVHCHNDFGLALANTLAAFEQGAQVLDVSINGVGDRAGNAAVDEVAVAVTVLYGRPAPVSLEKLARVAERFAVDSGVPLGAIKPLVGANAYAYKLDSHVQAVLTHAPTFEVMPPETVGNRRRFVLGRYAGPNTVNAKLAELGLTVLPERLPDFVRRIEELTLTTRRPPSDDEIRRIVIDLRTVSGN